MDPSMLGASGGLLGLLKGIGKGSSNAALNQLAVETSRYSPWTHLKADQLKTGNMIGDILGTAALMASMGGGGDAAGGGGGGGGGMYDVAGPNLWAGQNSSNMDYFKSVPQFKFKGF